MDKIKVLSSKGKVQLHSIIKLNLKKVIVLAGSWNGKEVIVKWSRHNKKETKIYKHLAEKGCPTIKIYTGFKMYIEDCSDGPERSVLVMDKLSLLDKGREDPFELGLDILYQLKFIHKFCVHSGIKPDNILKNTNGRSTSFESGYKFFSHPGYSEVSDSIMSKGRECRYILMDFGSVSDEKGKRGGYYRHSWPVGWSSQDRKEKGQEAYPFHDYVELGTTLIFLSRNDKEKRKMKKFRDLVFEGAKNRDLRKFLESGL